MSIFLKVLGLRNCAAIAVAVGTLFAEGVARADSNIPIGWDALAPEFTPDNSSFSGAGFDELMTLFSSVYGAEVVNSLETEIWKHTTLAKPYLDSEATIDGYVLPLDSDGHRATEFLLVPWVGACIHTPAPPPNQTIHVTYPQGLELKKPFEPVRMRGVLKKKPAYYPMFLVDGTRAVPAAYSLQEAAVFGTPGPISASSSGRVPVVSRVQIWVNELFTTSMASLGSGGFSKSLVFALLLSFGYGALHTLGPGHGKTVVTSYFIGTGGSFQRGVAMGVRIAILHVFSAVLAVFLFDLAMRQVTGAPPSDYRTVRLASYSLIIAIGSAMLWQALSAARAYRKHVAHAAHTHNHRQHNHHEHGHHHDHAHHDHHQSGCTACAAAEAPKGSGWIAASVGVVPCTGALLVLLFGLANDLIWPAILMVFFISAGMAVAMSAIGVAALWGRQIAERKLSSNTQSRTRFELGARVTGAACVLVVGILLFSLTWANHVPLLTYPQGEYVQADRSGDGLGG